jgi:hypothetical protein
VDVHDGSAAALFWRALATASVSTAGAGTSPPPSAADRTAARGCWSRFIAFTMSLIRRGTCASVPPPPSPSSRKYGQVPATGAWGLRSSLITLSAVPGL